MAARQELQDLHEAWVKLNRRRHARRQDPIPYETWAHRLGRSSLWTLERERCGLTEMHAPEAPPCEARRIGENIPHVLGRIRVDRAELLTVLQAEWSALVGEDNAARTSPSGIDNKVLTIEVKGAIWFSQLQRVALRSIEARIQSRFGKTEIRRVILRQV